MQERFACSGMPSRHTDRHTQKTHTDTRWTGPWQAVSVSLRACLSPLVCVYMCVRCGCRGNKLSYITQSRDRPIQMRRCSAEFLWGREGVQDTDITCVAVLVHHISNTMERSKHHKNTHSLGNRSGWTSCGRTPFMEEVRVLVLGGFINWYSGSLCLV